MSNKTQGTVNQWGGVRAGAGNSYRWRHGRTKPVRLPIVLLPQILHVARLLDEGYIFVPSNRPYPPTFTFELPKVSQP
jgi:hypothetical protein